MQNSTEQKSVRLQKAIADSGHTSRRKAEELILKGKVTVNRQVVTELGTKVIPSEDIIEIEGKLIDSRWVEKLYVVLNKPRGVVTTMEDPEGRQTVKDLCKGIPSRIFPVGRLDYLSEGLIIMTNDGMLANQVMHPRYEVTKVYEVKVFGVINDYILNKLRLGVRDYDGLLKPKSVRVLKFLRGKTWLEFRLTEGRNREIRRLCDAHGLTIDKLKRVAIENLSIDGLKPGDFKILTRSRILNLLNITANGTKKRANSNYKSSKRSVSRRKAPNGNNSRSADDPVYHALRKNAYQGTMRKRKETSSAEAELGNQ